MLKLLSRVTAPTEGSIRAKGRIGSLLEVGTGFHPELTGRENIYMNGTIMGMTKTEITSRLDEIIDFAGVEKYIDTPTKRYSSGMTVRLGFAIAAHLEPEILVVDEVLAVGDAEFQKKAIGKMKDVSEGAGRTVLFVSHNMQAVSTLTNNSVLLADGKVEMIDKTENVIQRYLSSAQFDNIYINNNRYSDKPTITKVECISSHAGNIQQLGERMEFIFEIENPIYVQSAAISYQIVNSRNIPVLHILNLSEEIPFCKEPGKYIIKSTIPKIHLYPDNYRLIVHFADNKTKTKYETLIDIVSFEVKVFGNLRDYYWYPNNATYVENSFWNIEK